MPVPGAAYAMPVPGLEGRWHHSTGRTIRYASTRHRIAARRLIPGVLSPLRHAHSARLHLSLRWPGTSIPTISTSPGAKQLTGCGTAEIAGDSIPLKLCWLLFVAPCPPLSTGETITLRIASMPPPAASMTRRRYQVARYQVACIPNACHGT
eukprot:718927-Rhodomonas_salina.4